MVVYDINEKQEYHLRIIISAYSSLSHCIYEKWRLEKHFSVETYLLFLDQFEITTAISMSLPTAIWKDGMSLMNS